MSLITFQNLPKNKILISTEVLPMIRERLSVKDKSAKFIKKQNPYYADRKYCITKSGKFEAGMFFEIIKCLKELNLYSDITVDGDLFKKIRPEFGMPESFELSKLSLIPYDYQVDAVMSMFKQGRGTILIGTGGGKTLIMSLFLKTLFDNIKPFKTLVIVPTIQLVEQTYSDMIEYGIPPEYVSKWSGNNKFIDANIIIAGDDILQSDNSDTSFLRDIEILIIDEVHIVKRQNEINRVIDDTTTPHRFGFTGTLPEEIIDQWNITGKIGKVIYERKSKELRDDEVLSPVNITILDIEYNTKTNLELLDIKDPTKSPYQKELEFCTTNHFRNEIISIIAKTTKGNTLVMVDRIAHGELLLTMLKTRTNKDIYFIQGSVDVNDREVVRKIMEENSNVVCIVISSLFSTGINIKNIQYIILCTPGKAKVKLIQSIGRGLRLHKDKKRLVVYDVADNFKYSAKHLTKRLKLYQSEKLDYEIKKINQPTNYSGS
jgi:superfamily II DNA or RNA helicase